MRGGQSVPMGAHERTALAQLSGEQMMSKFIGKSGQSVDQWSTKSGILVTNGAVFLSNPVRAPHTQRCRCDDLCAPRAHPR